MLLRISTSAISDALVVTSLDQSEINCFDYE